MEAYKDIYQSMAETASFLWEVRSTALNAPNYIKEEIAEIEQRIEAQLNGLIAYKETAWEVIAEELKAEQAGEVFTAAIFAFRCNDIDKIKIVISTGFINDDTFKGLVSAFGWLPGKIIQPWITDFLNSKDIDYKYLAISACSVRSEDPADLLTKLVQREDCVAHEKFYARALRLIGELRRVDLLSSLTTMPSENETTVFWSAWSAVLLGDKTAVNTLKQFICNDCDKHEIAIQLVFQVLTVELGRKWISEIVKDENNIRIVVKAVSILGDPFAINWLITLMKRPELARLAGESFTTITGIDLEQYNLYIDDSKQLSNGPNDNPDDNNIEIEEDEELPWPNVVRINTFWQQHRKNLQDGQRYFLGQEINQEHLHNILQEGNQRQRHRAALELAMLVPEQKLLNINQRI